MLARQVGFGLQRREAVGLFGARRRSGEGDGGKAEQGDEAKETGRHERFGRQVFRIAAQNLQTILCEAFRHARS